MKKIIPTIIGLALIIPSVFAYYEYTKIFTILELNQTTKNLIVENEGKNMLLHFTGRCDEMQEGGRITISIQSELNSNGDVLVASSDHRCPVDEAEEVNGELIFSQVFSDYSGIVTDDMGNEYQVQYDARCTSMPSYWKQKIYLYKAGSALAVGDKIYLPKNEGSCSLLYIKKQLPTAETEKPEGDVTRPSMVSSVTATPENGSVSLNWRAASDNVGVDHYVISYSPYALNTQEYSFNDMPNKIMTSSSATSYKVTGLTNEDLYFFYIVAVDASGNVSSTWSPQASATPKSSISPAVIKTDLVRIFIYKTQETLSSFLFRWNRIPSFVRQSVILEADGVRDFSSTDWAQNYIRILKKDSRKDKPLKLIVRQYDIHEQMFEKEYEFSF
jgi:hypothetical protein